MKKTLILLLAAGITHSAFSQTNSQLSQLQAARNFLSTTDMVYPYIDSSPGYPGGDQKWSNYVGGASHMKAAIEKAKASSLPDGSYTVIVKFAVNADSTVSEVTTVGKPIGYGLEEAAIKLVKESGKWIPAHIEGEHKRSFLQLPVKFSIYRR